MSEGPRGAAGATGGAPAATARERLLARLRSIRRACRQVFGIPDFERYLAHMRSRHPGAPVLSEREFHAMAIDRRYGGTRPRCC